MVVDRDSWEVVGAERCQRQAGAVEHVADRVVGPGIANGGRISDALGCFGAVTQAGCRHQPIVTGGGAGAVRIPAFKWVNTTIGNIKNAIRGTYHAIRPKHVPRYLAQYEYRFNRRYRLEDMIPRLAWVAMRTPPMPYRLLKSAEDTA